MSAPAPTPPHALVQQWWEDAYREHGHSLIADFAQRAAIWGASQQLDSCERWVTERLDPWLAQRMVTATALSHPVGGRAAVDLCTPSHHHD